MHPTQATYPYFPVPFLFSTLRAANLAFAAAALSADKADPLTEVMVLVLLPALDMRLADRPIVATEPLTVGLSITSDGSNGAGFGVGALLSMAGFMGFRFCVRFD